MTFCVGLTGGIGCGKTAATDIFAELGAGIVDTDVISRELTVRGGAAMPAISTEFGERYVLPDGSLDRARMRELVFGDGQAKHRLESILHPLIREKSRAGIEDSRAPYVVLVVPLLLETGAYRDLLDRIVVVDCDETTQIERVVARSGLSRAEVERIMRAQLSRSERLAAAHDVLRNDADISALRRQVEQLHAKYLAASGGTT